MADHILGQVVLDSGAFGDTGFHAQGLVRQRRAGGVGRLILGLHETDIPLIGRGRFGGGLHAGQARASGLDP